MYVIVDHFHDREGSILSQVNVQVLTVLKTYCITRMFTDKDMHSAKEYSSEKWKHNIVTEKGSGLALNYMHTTVSVLTFE